MGTQIGEVVVEARPLKVSLATILIKKTLILSLKDTE
jgi:hypothetical protein